MVANQVKSIVNDLGADLCGIASKDRFNTAPEGFRPTDIYNQCKSVIVFAKRLPSAAIYAESCVPYTHINNIMTQEVDRLGIEICLALERKDIGAVPIPSDDPFEHWEADRDYARAILSMRHAGYFAGLGVLGKNTLLINEKYGNMIQIGAVLTDVELEQDEFATYEVCPENCNLCLNLCPQGALDGQTVNQKLCRPLSNYRNEKGFNLKKCNLCRVKCPNSLGLK